MKQKHKDRPLPTNRQIETRFTLIRTLTAAVIALAGCLILILVVSEEPWEAFSAFLFGPLESARNIATVFETAAPLVYAGLAVSVMFSCNQFNMAGEGALYIGGLVASAVAVKLSLPIVVHPILALLLGGVAGAVVCFIPGLLKVKLGATEVVSSLMLNYIVLYLGVYILNYFLIDPAAGFPATERLPETAQLSTLIPRTHFHVGTILAFVLCVVVYLYLYKSKQGYAIRMVGQNEKFAKYSGIGVGGTILSAQLAGGFLAGMGGASEILGSYTRFQWVALPGFGFDGVIVATLAGNNPLLVPLGALFLGYLRVGADIMSRRSDVATEVLSIVQGTIILLVASKLFLQHIKHKYIVSVAEKRESLAAAAPEAAPEGGEANA